MWRIFSSFERAWASSQILSYLEISSCGQRQETDENTFERLAIDIRQVTGSGQDRLSDLILLSWDGAFGDELLSVFLQNSFLLLDLFVHQRLSEHRLIHLIVAITAVTYLKGKSSYSWLMSWTVTISQNNAFIKDTKHYHSPGPPPHLCGRWLSTLRPRCTRTLQLQDHQRWRGIWGHWPHGQRQ